MLVTLWASFMEEQAWAPHGEQDVTRGRCADDWMGGVTLLRKSPLVSNQIAHVVMPGPHGSNDIYFSSHLWHLDCHQNCHWLMGSLYPVFQSRANSLGYGEEMILKALPYKTILDEEKKSEQPAPSCHLETALIRYKIENLVSKLAAATCYAHDALSRWIYLIMLK